MFNLFHRHKWVDDKTEGFFRGGSSHCEKCEAVSSQLNDPTGTIVFYTALKVRQIGLGYCPICKDKKSHTGSCYFQELEKQFDEYIKHVGIW